MERSMANQPMAFETPGKVTMVPFLLRRLEIPTP
jgi:hypothetical protein